jgi:hypothetical protein
MQAFSQITLVGKWQRVNHNSKFPDTSNKQLTWGDIEIRSDSTFHIEGDSSTKNSTIPGWHVGEEYNGTWKLDDFNRLTLWMEPQEDSRFLWFKIIKLMKKKLVLRFGFNIDDRKNNIKYLRL